MRLFDHAMEHLHCRAIGWYFSAPMGTTEESAADTLCILFNRYYIHVEKRYVRKQWALVKECGG